MISQQSHFHLFDENMLHDLEDNIEHLSHLEDVVVKDLKKRLRTNKNDDEDFADIDAVMHRTRSRNAVDSEYEYEDEDYFNEGSGRRTVYIM